MIFTPPTSCGRGDKVTGTKLTGADDKVNDSAFQLFTQLFTFFLSTLCGLIFLLYVWVYQNTNTTIMKSFKLENDHIGYIGFEEQEYTNAVFCLHDMIKNNEDWLNDYPKAKWNVNLFDDETSESKIVYSLTTSKIKKLQKDGLF